VLRNKKRDPEVKGERLNSGTKDHDCVAGRIQMIAAEGLSLGEDRWYDDDDADVDDGKELWFRGASEGGGVFKDVPY
jgi:hypothetical protein